MDPCNNLEGPPFAFTIFQVRTILDVSGGSSGIIHTVFVKNSFSLIYHFQKVNAHLVYSSPLPFSNIFARKRIIFLHMAIVFVKTLIQNGS